MENFDSIYFSRFAIDPDSEIAGIDLEEDYSLLGDDLVDQTYDEICSYESNDIGKFQSQ